MKLYGLNINKKFSHERMNIKAILSKDESKQLMKKKKQLMTYCHCIC